MIEHSVHELIVEAVGVGMIDKVQHVAVGLDEVGYRLSILPFHSLWSLEGIGQYVDCLLVQPTGYKQIPSCCCPDQCTFTLVQLSACVWLEWIALQLKMNWCGVFSITSAVDNMP